MHGPEIMLGGHIKKLCKFYECNVKNKTNEESSQNVLCDKNNR
jgi:hypothetical protein